MKGICLRNPSKSPAEPLRVPQNTFLNTTVRQQGCSAFWAVRATTAKFGLHVGNTAFNIHNE